MQSNPTAIIPTSIVPWLSVPDEAKAVAFYKAGIRGGRSISPGNARRRFGGKAFC